MHHKRKGFTIVELMVVILVIGVLASIALPEINSTRNKATLAAVRSDVRNAQTAEEEYFAMVGTYGTVAQLRTNTSFSVTAGVTLTITTGANGYTINGTSPAIGTGPSSCSVQVGDGTAPAIDGQLLCP